MKIFVFKKNNIVIYSLIAVLTVGLISYNLLYTNSEPTVSRSNVEKNLPVYCVENDKKQVAITFDCAWEDKDTDQILSVLGKYKAKATFFAVGEWLDRCESSAKKINKAGHELMNHSNQHTYPTKQSKEDLLADIESCSLKIEKITGQKPTLYRAPAGDYNDTVIKTVKAAGYQTVQWSVDSLDWKNLSSDEIYNRIIEKTKSGDILLFHTGVKNTPAALEKVLNKLSSEGYTFVPASELILKDNYVIDANGKQKATEPTVMETFE